MDRSSQSHMLMPARNIGDLLITFNSASASFPSRGSQGWHRFASYGSAALWSCPSAQSWHGFPLSGHQSDTWHIWLLGELFPAPANLESALTHPESLNGHFILIAWDKNSHHWHIITNRLGTLHTYHAQGSRACAFGTFSPAVASAAGCASLNWQAIAAFLKFGFFLGDETWWQSVNLFSPASRTVLDERGRVLAVTPFWSWGYHPDPALTPDQALVQFKETFEQVLSRLVAGKTVALPLSGGLDSRSTLAVLGTPQMGGARALFPYSYGYGPDSVETAIAGQLARRRALDLKIWHIQPYLFDRLDAIIAAIEGFQDLTLCRQAFVIDELSQSADAVLAAHWGDVWLDDMGFLDQPPCSDSLLAAQISRKFTKNGSSLLLDLFAPLLPPDWQEVLQSKITASLSALAGISEPDFKVKAWKTSHWSRRWTLSSLRMFQAGLFPLLPFYDNQLVDLFFRIPSAFMRSRQLQIDYLKKFAPDLARVNWQPYDADLFHYRQFNTWLLPKRAFKKIARAFNPRPVIQRNWEVQFLNPRGRQALANELLSASREPRAILPSQKIHALLIDFYQAPDAARGYALSMLLTFSAWLERYGPY